MTRSAARPRCTHGGRPGRARSAEPIDVAVAHLKEGSIAAAAGKTPEHLGITKEQLDLAAAQQGQKKITIDVFMVNPENASKYYFPDSVF